WKKPAAPSPTGKASRPSTPATALPPTARCWKKCWLTPGGNSGCKRLRLGFAGRQRLQQPIHKLGLGRVELGLGGLGIEPAAAIDLGNLDELARARWPFHAEGVAANGVRIGIAGKGPGLDRLAALLFDGAQRQERPGWLDASFLGKFAAGGSQRFFTWLDQSLGNGPHSQVAVLPERPTRMGQKDLHRVTLAAIQQQAGTSRSHVQATLTLVRPGQAKPRMRSSR